VQAGPGPGTGSLSATGTGSVRWRFEFRRGPRAVPGAVTARVPLSSQSHRMVRSGCSLPREWQLVLGQLASGSLASF
jgi:hypothetical protein